MTKNPIFKSTCTFNKIFSNYCYLVMDFWQRQHLKQSADFAILFITLLLHRCRIRNLGRLFLFRAVARSVLAVFVFEIILNALGGPDTRPGPCFSVLIRLLRVLALPPLHSTEVTYFIRLLNVSNVGKLSNNTFEK